MFTCRSGMGNGTWIQWDLFPGTHIPGLGTGIETDSLGTLETGKNIAGTVPAQESLAQPNSSFGTSWDSSPLGFLSLMGTIGIFWNLCPMGLLGLGKKSLGQSRDSELWDSSPFDKNA